MLDRSYGDPEDSRDDQCSNGSYEGHAPKSLRNHFAHDW